MTSSPHGAAESNPDQAPGERLGLNLFGALLLHAAAAAAIAAWALFAHTSGHSWGEQSAAAGAIQATLVSALPLPNTQRTLDKAVLTSDAPSPAPVVTKEQTAPPPKPDEVAIHTRDTKPVKVADRVAPEPPRRPQPVPVEPAKATNGETAGVQIPQATTQLRNGTATATVQDRAFGSRFAYYINIVNRAVAQNWYTQEADPRASNGKRVTVVFDINRDGSPSNIRILTRSGSPSLDVSALRAVQRVEGFGPLPQGDHITVEYAFDYHLQ